MQEDEGVVDEGEAAVELLAGAGNEGIGEPEPPPTGPLEPGV